MAGKKSGIKKTSQTIGIVLLSLLMLAGFSVYFLPHIGWRVDGLRSGSMEPKLMIGDLIVTCPVVPADITVGDIIMFHAPPGTAVSIISHRVIGIQGNPPLIFQTKGDANAAADPFTVPARDVVGRFSSRIPRLGNVVIFLKTFPGLLVSLVAPGLGIIWVCLKSLRDELLQKVHEKHLEEVQ